MSNQRDDFRLLKQHYDDIGKHKVTKNYANFHEKVPISITCIENIKVTKFYSMTNAIMYPSYSVDCENQFILDVANAIFSSPATTTILDPLRKASKHIYEGQARSPEAVASRFTSHMQVRAEAMPRNLYNKISLNINNAMFTLIAFTFYNFKQRQTT